MNDSNKFAKTFAALYESAVASTGDQNQEQLEPIENLKPGVYSGLRYGYVFEIPGYKKFRTKTGIRCMREHCGGLRPFELKEDGTLMELPEPKLLEYLDDGDYFGYRYKNIFELKDGRMFDTSPIYVKCTKSGCGGLKKFRKENDNVYPLD